MILFIRSTTTVNNSGQGTLYLDCTLNSSAIPSSHISRFIFLATYVDSMLPGKSNTPAYINATCVDYFIFLFQNTPKKIPLVASEIAETNIDEKSNAFRIRPSDSKRVYYMYADDENTQHNWMQAICFAKAAGHTGDESQACTLQ